MYKNDRFGSSVSKEDVAPQLLEVLPNRFDAFVVEPVHTPCALGLIRDQARLFEQAKVARHGRAADRQVVGQLLNRAGAALQQFQNGAPVGMREGVERVSMKGLASHSAYGNSVVTDLAERRSEF